MNYIKIQKSGRTDSEEKGSRQSSGATFLASVRKNLKGQLDTIKIQKEDGTIVDLKNGIRKNMEIKNNICAGKCLTAETG